MRIQVGASSRTLDGFVNVEPRPVGANTRRGHAADLGFADDGSVDMVFSNAVFEHLYLGQQLAALREWRRVLSANGAVVCIGLPDFEAVARLYLEGARPGIVSDTFDLFEVYRATHGDPEQLTRADWSRWSPRWHLNSAPTEWLPQLHKTLFDAPTLAALFEAADLVPTVVRYRYPTDGQRLNIGVVAGLTARDARVVLESIPGVEDFVDMTTVEVAADRGHGTGMVDQAVKLDAERLSRLQQVARAVRRRYNELRGRVRR